MEESSSNSDSFRSFITSEIVLENTSSNITCFHYESEICLITISDTTYFSNSVFDTVCIAQGSFKLASYLLRS